MQEWNLHVGGNRTVLLGAFNPEVAGHFNGAVYHLEKSNLYPDRTHNMAGEASIIFSTPEKIDHFVFRKGHTCGIGIVVANKSGMLEAAEGTALVAREPHSFIPLKDTNLDFRGHHEEQMVVITDSPQKAASAIRQLVGIGAVDLRTAARSFLWSAQPQDADTPFECIIPIAKGREARVLDGITSPPSRTEFITLQPMVLHHQPNKTFVDAVRDTLLDLSGVCTLGSNGPVKKGYENVTLTADTLNRLSPVAQSILENPNERHHDLPTHGRG